MDKNAIKKYAIWARRELIERVSQKALQYGISADVTANIDVDVVNGYPLSVTEKKQRKALIQMVSEHGYEQVMEEVAYTWFNRFIALRFMEVNGYLPSHVRVFTNDAGEFKPQILSEAIHLEIDGLNIDKVYELKTANKEDELFKYLLIVQCNALNNILPGMFQRIEDYTELLLPNNLLREGSVIERLVQQNTPDSIPESDWTEQVQIIGWLYQYYNTEPKDKVFADLKKNIKITKENIPAATQLFTPDWIVRYMVENSLGRLWLEGHPNDALKSEWKYYLDEAKQEEDVQKQLDEIRKEYATLKPEEIKCIDPCSGSGHILCYLFDVLIQIYEAYGYTAREAATSIIKNNLWGLDIDERASQLSYFAVMMKARQYDRRFFSRKDDNGNLVIPQPHVYAIVESNKINSNTVSTFVNGNDEIKKHLTSLMSQLYDAKEYGSILQVKDIDFNLLYSLLKEMKTEDDLFASSTIQELKPLLDVGQALAQKYDVVVTNPPYMGASNMNGILGDFIKANYAEYKSDFFSAFIVRATQMTKINGYCGFFTPYVWMFIQSYEKLRQLLCTQKTIETLIQFEYSAFEEATVPVCTFVFSNRHISKKGCYFRLTAFRGGMEVQKQKTLDAIEDHNCGYYYESNADNFSKIPGSPVVYWASDKLSNSFAIGQRIDTIGASRSGLQTGNNDLFLRFWFEVCHSKINFFASPDEKVPTNKWFPHPKGGSYRKWYGNLEYVVNFENAGLALRNYQGTSIIKNPQFYFHEGFSWSHTTSKAFSARYLPKGCIFNVEAPSFYPKRGESLNYVLGMVNTKVLDELFNCICQTMHFMAGDMSKIPIVKTYNPIILGKIEYIVDANISVSKTDWDSFETSWDFSRHPLVRCVATVKEAYSAWERECEERFNTLKANEEELNRIFIDIYGLQDELTPEVADKDVTVRKADLERDIQSLISYAVGCMFGRYSLDVSGLTFAGGAWDSTKYSTYQPDKDGIIPICDDEYFEDDIVGRFVRFIEIVYGKEMLEENLQFIANALGGKGTSRDVIRNYFLNDFYADHLKIYQKRPIYWLFDSGKRNGFKCLIYMHRYQPDTTARIRTDYVHEQQSRYRTAIADLEKRLDEASGSERVKLSRQLTNIQAQATEIQEYEEKIHHLADQMIKIDLDDGVKHNYEIFKDVLARIK